MNCRICGNKNNNKEYTGKDMWFGNKEVFNYFQCSRCDCLQIEDYPTNISEYYPNDNYYSFQFSSSKNKKSLFRKLIINSRNEYALFRRGIVGKLLFSSFPTNSFNMLTFLQINKYTKILDVGCGNGDFLYSLSELGFKNLLGTDPFLKMELKYENGLRILNKEIFDITDKFDIVSLKNSFEHMPNPVKILEYINSLLINNGNCVIRIPIVSSYAWQHYKENWIQFDAPRHFYLHSVKSMEILASQTGFDLYNILYDSDIFQFLGSEQILNNIPLNDDRSWLNNPQKSNFSKKQISTYKQKAIELDANKEGDVAIFFLRKTSNK